MLPGNVLVREGDMCNSLHVILTGRLRSSRIDRSKRDQKPTRGDAVVDGVDHLILSPTNEEGSGEGDRSRTLSDPDTHPQIAVEEHGLGASIGEMELLAGACYPVTVTAIRDTELVKLSRGLFTLVAE